MKQYRQGDILLKEIEEITGKQIGKTKRVLAEGSSTGHKHILTGNGVVFFEIDNGQIQIYVPNTAKLTHKEHQQITVKKGKYVMVKQREVDLLGVIRQVID